MKQVGQVEIPQEAFLARAQSGPQMIGQMFSQLLTVLAWAALPVTLIAVIDDWFLRPRRQHGARASAAAPDPPLMRGDLLLLPVLLLAAVIGCCGRSGSTSAWCW